ncbi:MAG: cysteine desulfurase, SufS subfamily [Pseudomonadota bacterium]|jgi:cysteine desulfurase/selenocysteine lyase|nr:cysteine desulfurase [Gammaproteobacteria bacterium]
MTAQGYDVARVRADFPILATTVRGKRLAFLDTAASSQRPQAVIDAMAHYERTSHANVHRGVYELSQKATDAFEGARERIRRFLNAASVREIVFTRGTTESINLVAQSWGRRLGPGDEILITWMEHHANIVPWQMLCERTGAMLRVTPIDLRGELDVAAFEALLSPRTKLVAFTQISNSLGTVLPVERLLAAAKRVGALTLIDGAQAVAHQRIDVRALDCDFYVFSSHKLYGPTGLGVLYAREAVLADMPPWQGGGDMIRTVTFSGSTWTELPHRFEAGTPHISGAVGLATAIDYLESLGIDAVHAHEQRLLARATQALRAVPGLRIVGEAAHKAGVISFVLEDVHPHDLGTILDAEGVAVRTGHHCAMPVMDFFDVPATARASFGCYSDDADIDQLVTALGHAREVFG